MFRAPSLLQRYEIDTKDFKKNFGSKPIEELISFVECGAIWFPYRRYFHLKPCTMFSNLVFDDLNPTYEPYKLVSYFPSGGLYLPPRFRGKPVSISTEENTYNSVDALSDYFIEDVRLKAKRYDQEYSIDEMWKRPEGLDMIFRRALEDPEITPCSLRDSIYYVFPETQVFSPSWAKAIIKLVLGPYTINKKWLDISAGWGDRLLTAISLDMIYTGFDPNKELIPGHSEMIDIFGDRSRQQVIYEPFEKATIPQNEYDVVFTSPPYFTVEEYVKNQEGQSTVEYPDFIQWMTKFLFASLSKAWDHLKDGGYLILHISDTKIVKFAEPTNLFIEDYLTDSSWEGVIAVKRPTGPPRPVWVWKKSSGKKRWNPSKLRSLQVLYPELDAVWKDNQKNN